MCIGAVLWLVICVGTLAISLRDWDEKNFEYFRLFILGSTLYHAVSNIRGRMSFRRGDTKIHASILSYDQMNKVFGVCILLEILAMLGALLQIPVVTYPFTGMTFSIMVIISSYVGRMDHMTDSVKGEESTPLTDDSSAYSIINPVV